MATKIPIPPAKPPSTAPADDDEVAIFRASFSSPTSSGSGASATGIPAPASSASSAAATGIPAPASPAAPPDPFLTSPVMPPGASGPAAKTAADPLLASPVMPPGASGPAAKTAADPLLASPVMPPGVSGPGAKAGGPDLDPSTAFAQANAAFQAQHGRPMTPAEQQQLIAATGYTSGNVTAQQMASALALIQGYNATAPGAPTPAPGGTAPTAPGAAPGSIDPTKAQADVTAAFRTRFGRAPSTEELNWLIKQAGYTGGMVTDAQLAAALDSVSRYTGNLTRPFNVATPSGPEEEEANQRLIELLGEKWGEVDPNSPALKAQRDAFGLASQRETTRRRAAAAERAAARGTLGSGGFDVTSDAILADEGERGQAFEAQLIGKELEGQRTRLMQGIEMAKRYGLQEKAQTLQEQLALLELDLRKLQTRGQLGLGLLGLQQQNSQFYDDLGYRFFNSQNAADEAAFRAMFGL